jgi:plasmid stability protein
MCRTYKEVEHMAVTVQIRNVPDDIHRKLKARAALAGGAC